MAGIEEPRRARPRRTWRFRVAAAVLAGAPFVAVPACSEASDAPPNVVLVVLDTMRADYFSFLGYPRETSPFLAGLAAESAVFRNAYSTSSWTAPSTTSLLTGVYPDRHGVQKGFLMQMRETVAGESGEPVAAESIKLMKISAATETLPEFFSSKGYATFGIAANINIGQEIGFDRGFEASRFLRESEWTAGKVYSELATWKDDIRSSEPYFLYLHLNDVHKPYQQRRKWYEPVEGVPELALYQSEMGYLDHWLGRMFELLELDEDTLVVVVSDHGEEFLDHGGMGHHFSLYNELSRMVFLVHGPGLGVTAGAHERNVSGIDLAPTVIELAGFAPEADRYDGTSLAPFIVAGASEAVVADRESSLRDRPVFGHRKGLERDLYSVVSGKWKLMGTDEKMLLFDLENDPDETQDLSAQEPARLAELQRLLDGYLARDFDADSAEANVDIDPDILRQLQDLGYVQD